MKYLIVNADDFGLTSGVNRAVIEGHSRGIITSTTLMANMPAFDQAVLLAKDYPALGIGLHFNITEGRPVAQAERVRSLINERQKFLGTSTALARRIITGKLLVEDVIVELRAQIERVLDTGLHLTHIDSHKHSHALPQVCSAIIETIMDYRISAVRLPREQWNFYGLGGSRRMIAQSIGALGLSQLCRFSSARLMKSGVKTTDAFYGISQTGFWTKESLRRVIEQLPDGVSELMCHPGYEDDELKGIETRLRRSRTVELQLLSDPEIRDVLQRNRVNLVDYSYFTAEAL